MTGAATSTFETVSDDEQPRQISIVRVFLAVLLIVGAILGGILGVRNQLAASASVPTAWFGPYVDVTLTPTYQFQNPALDVARQTVLGFVVADRKSSCSPSWGAAYSLSQASQSLDLDSRIAQVKAEGANVIASFGGQKNTSLQVACTNVSSLARAYLSVINRYHITTIDLDIEGQALNDFPANQRLASAMSLVEHRYRGSKHLAVWLTFPVEPSGLQDNALSVIGGMLRARVAIAGINAMTMDFSDPSSSGANMLGSVEQALSATHAQLASLFPRYGIELRSKTLWSRMGATVMIGQNNIAGEQFTVDDAAGLVNFAHNMSLGRVSLWSLNRDSQCGSNFSENGVLSKTCSGVAQDTLAFSKTLGVLSGVASQRNHVGPQVLSVTPDTNLADSPYPQWAGTQPYQTGYKVVRNAYIYQAKWYNQGVDPAIQVQDSWETPWLLIGPVVVGDHPPALPTLPAGTYPAWSLSQSYTAGQNVLFNGLPYQAKWDSQGASPAAQAVDPEASPWQPLFTIPGEPKAGP